MLRDGSRWNVSAGLGDCSMDTLRSLNVYVASSWRNTRQPEVVAALRRAGHSVYDFRNPGEGEHGFAWARVDPAWQQWTPSQFRDALRHPVARRGFALDMRALAAADVTVLVLPCGRSAHLELGYAAAAGQRTFVLCDSTLDEPDLMYGMATNVCLSISELLEALQLHSLRPTGS
jgi:hypothetical protein